MAKLQQTLAVLLAIDAARAFVVRPRISYAAAGFMTGRSATNLIKMQATATDDVTLTETTHRLYFVDSIEYIGTGEAPNNTDVPAWQLTNNVGMSVTAMAEGANMVQVGASTD